MSSSSESRSLEDSRPGEKQLIWVIWLTYGAFYFCRTNLSAALPGIEAELGYSKTTMGQVLFALKCGYALGQLVNGQMAERLSPRKMLAIGMFGSAMLNVVFGFGTGLYFFIFVWAMNGYSQSLGWTPCVRVVGNWIPVDRRGRAIGIIGTGYQLTAGLTFVVSGTAVWLFDWRAALLVPPVLLVASAVVMLLFLEEEPGAEASPQQQDTRRRPTGGVLENFRLTLTNPALWILAVTLGLLNACRYGFIDWGISHLHDLEQTSILQAEIGRRLSEKNLSPAHRRLLEPLQSQDLSTLAGRRDVRQAVEAGAMTRVKASRSSILKSAVKYAVLPLGAILGSFLAGWATDRFFGHRRAPVICGLLLILGGLTLCYDSVARISFVGTMVLLGCVGFCVYGPQVLLVGTAPADLARRGTAAAAAGFVNFIGYVGAACGDILTGRLADEHGWQFAIRVWAGWAFMAALLIATLWNARSSEAEDEQQPGLESGSDREV